MDFCMNPSDTVSPLIPGTAMQAVNPANLTFGELKSYPSRARSAFTYAGPAGPCPLYRGLTIFSAARA